MHTSPWLDDSIASREEAALLQRGVRLLLDAQPSDLSPLEEKILAALRASETGELSFRALERDLGVDRRRAADATRALVCKLAREAGFCPSWRAKTCFDVFVDELVAGVAMRTQHAAEPVER